MCPCGVRSFERILPLPEPFSPRFVKLLDLLQQSRTPEPAEEVVLNVLVTQPWLVSEIATAMEPFGITPGQYNVLRILRGSHPERVSCSYIGSRLLDRTPDVTRLLDRLEKLGLTERRRAEHDRRVVEVGITEAGLDLLDRLDAPVSGAITHATRHLTDDEKRTLSALLEKLRTDQAR
jgi:DNA-binding MarR family transcriptional regulator